MGHPEFKPDPNPNLDVGKSLQEQLGKIDTSKLSETPLPETQQERERSLSREISLPQPPRPAPEAKKERPKQERQKPVSDLAKKIDAEIQRVQEKIKVLADGSDDKMKAQLEAQLLFLARYKQFSRRPNEDLNKRVDETLARIRRIEVGSKEDKPRPGRRGRKERVPRPAAVERLALAQVEPQPAVEPEVSVKEAEPISPLRAAAWYTIEHLNNYEELQHVEDGRELTTKEERQARFKELVIKYWREFTLHGTYGEADMATGKPAMLPTSDLDGSACLFLLKEAGIDLEKSKIDYVPPGQTAESGVVIDTSNRFGVIAEEGGKKLTIDHHTMEAGREQSAAKMLYKLLSNPEIDLLKSEPWLEKFTEFVTQEDNKNYTDAQAKELLENYGRNFVSLADNLDFEEIKKFFKDGSLAPLQALSDADLEKLNFKFTFAPLKGNFSEVRGDISLARKARYKQESLAAIAELEKEGLVLDTGDKRFGKVLIDTGWKNRKDDWVRRVRLDFDAVRPSGYGAYLVWLPERKQFFLKTAKKIDFDLPGAYNVRGHYLLKGDRTADLQVKAEEILAKLAGNDNFEIPEELKAALARAQTLASEAAPGSIEAPPEKSPVLTQEEIEALSEQTEKEPPELEQQVAAMLARCQEALAELEQKMAGINDREELAGQKRMILDDMKDKLKRELDLLQTSQDIISKGGKLMNEQGQVFVGQVFAETMVKSADSALREFSALMSDPGELERRVREIAATEEKAEPAPVSESGRDLFTSEQLEQALADIDAEPLPAVSATENAPAGPVAPDVEPPPAPEAEKEKRIQELEQELKENDKLAYQAMIANDRAEFRRLLKAYKELRAEFDELVVK